MSQIKTANLCIVGANGTQWVQQGNAISTDSVVRVCTFPKYEYINGKIDYQDPY